MSRITEGVVGDVCLDLHGHFSNEDDGEVIEQKPNRLRIQLLSGFDEPDRLERLIRQQLKGPMGNTEVPG